MQISEKSIVVISSVVIFIGLLILLFSILTVWGHAAKLAFAGVLCSLLLAVGSGIGVVSCFNKQPIAATVGRSLPFSAFFLVSTSVFILWLFAYFPGCMTNDSFDQWNQAITLKFHNIHPYLHTLYITFFQRVFGSPAGVCIFQILLTSASFSYYFHYFWRNKVSKPLILFFFLLFCISVPVGIYNVTLWKDVPFSILLILAAFILAIKSFERKWSRIDVVLFTISALIVMLFRHNGIVYLVFFPLMLCCRSGQKIVRWVVPPLLVVLYVFFAALVPKTLHVDTELAPCYKYSFVYQASIGFYSRQPYTVVTEKTKQLLESVFPPEELREKYDPAAIYPLAWSPRLDSELFCSDSYWHSLLGEFLKYNLIRNLPYFIGDRVNMFTSLTCGYGFRAASGFQGPAFPDGLGLMEDPLMPTLRCACDSFLFPERSWIVLLFWNQMFPLLLLLILFLRSCCTANKCFRTFSGTLLIQLPFLMLFIPGNEWRFAYCYYLAFFITLPMYMLDGSRNASRSITRSGS